MMLLMWRLMLCFSIKSAASTDDIILELNSCYEANNLDIPKRNETGTELPLLLLENSMKVFFDYAEAFPEDE